jgi:steroid delta-isomerase-like uncharacterized protein
METDLPRRWADAWSAHDPEALASLFTDDCVYEDVTFGVESAGHDGVREWATGFLAAFPDLEVEPLSAFGCDQRGVLEWRMHGTHHGQLGDMDPTGRRFEVRGVTVFAFEGDRIARCSDYWDIATVQRQFGYVAVLTPRAE